MSDTLPWDSDKPLSISQLLKQSMRSVDTIVKDGSLLDMMSTHLNGLLRQNRASEGDKSVMLFNNMFKQAENAMSSDSDKQVLNVLRRQVSSFIGITLGVKPFLEVQEQNQDQEDSSDDEEDDRHKLSLSAARQNESDTAWNESKSYYDQNNVDIFTPERVESEKMRQQEEQLAREYNQRDDEEDDEEEGDSSEYEEVVEEVQVKSREIGSREVGGGGEFKVVRRRQRKKKTQIETNFSYGGYHDNNRDDNNNNNNSRPYYKQPPRHRVRITEFHPKYLERLNQDVFCMPLFFPSEESYGYFHSALASAQETLYVCVYSITDNDTADVLIDAKKRGVDVRVITDNDQMDACKGSDVVRLNEKFGIPFKNDDSQQFMHNKFAVMDNKTVITGSFNWSLGARYKNRENIVITNIPSVVRAYSKQFDELWRFY